MIPERYVNCSISKSFEKYFQMQLDLHQTCLPPDDNYVNNKSDIFATQFHGLSTAQVCILVMVSGNCDSCSHV
jgi:hypothetical protein